MQETVVPEYDTSGGGLAEPSDLVRGSIAARAAMLHAKAGSPDPKLAGKAGLGLLTLVVVLFLRLFYEVTCGLNCLVLYHVVGRASAVPVVKRFGLLATA